jgi:hypothetical protein
MASTPQIRAIRSYRKRLTQRGMARFEVLGLAADRELIRTLARRLAEDNSEAREMRALVHRTVAANPVAKGNILAALRRSPLLGADLNLARKQVNRRKTGL